jgi:hypothetical protein
MIESNGIDYESLIPIFSEELGSVRDIYVLDTDALAWEKLLAALRESPWESELRLGDHLVGDVPAATILSEVPPEADTYTLRVTVGESWVWCHFYSVSEIEFSLQASQMLTALDVERLVAFMSWMSGVLDRDVKLTLEAPGGDKAPPLLLVRRREKEPQVFPT